jgi:hypothetical protein
VDYIAKRKLADFDLEKACCTCRVLRRPARLTPPCAAKTTIYGPAGRRTPGPRRLFIPLIVVFPNPV